MMVTVVGCQDKLVVYNYQRLAAKRNSTWLCLSWVSSNWCVTFLFPLSSEKLLIFGVLINKEHGQQHIAENLQPKGARCLPKCHTQLPRRHVIQNCRSKQTPKKQFQTRKVHTGCKSRYIHFGFAQYAGPDYSKTDREREKGTGRGGEKERTLIEIKTNQALHIMLRWR